MPRLKVLSVMIALGLSPLAAREASAFGIFDNNGLTGGSRWDATPRVLGGVERSLDGGLRYSIQGGNYQAFRDMFSWSGGVPTVSAFQQAVEGAFAHWTSVDPVSGLGTSLSFAPDFATPVSGSVSGFVRLGAEIDLFASTDGSNWDPGNSGLQAEAFFSSISVSGNLKLTSGTTNYSGFAISGADIVINSNPGAQYTLTNFRNLLTHELGHALGLADVDLNSGPNGRFIDDNYNGANSATAAATLNNSFALQINPLNPSLSPLSLYTVANGDPGFDTANVHILMESAIADPLFNGTGNPLRNDDYAGRQFLYPVIPEPGSGILALVGAAIVGCAAGVRRAG